MSEEIPAAICDNKTIKSKRSARNERAARIPWQISFFIFHTCRCRGKRPGGKAAKRKDGITMLDKNKVRIGIAPIAWTEDDMPEMGAENSFLQTISEIAT